MWRRIGVGLLTLLLLVVIGTIEAPQRAAAQYIGPGGALAISPGPKEVKGNGYAVDGDTINAYIEDQQVAVGLVGVRTPMGNTDCGLQATITLNKLFKQGLRLEEDPNVALDGRKRRMYRAYTLDGRPVAQQMVQQGIARSDGRGDDASDLDAIEDQAHRDRQGCVWKDGDPQTDLREPSWNLRQKDLRDLPQAPRRGGIDPLGLGNEVLGFLNFSNLLSPSLVLAQTQPTPGPFNPPANFAIDTIVSSGLVQPTVLAWLPDGRMLVGEKSGVVMLYKNGALQQTPFIDIRSRVNSYFDHGLIGMAVDPNFATNNYIYLLYTYEDNPTVFSGSKTARLARYTASGDTASPASEFVVLGQWVGPSCQVYPVGYDCLPSDDLSHSIGQVKFAPDGTVFVTAGDGASFSVVDPLALRAQDLTSLGGKLLHVTSTGQGVATNPFFNGDINANQSKVYALGLRNPYRFNIRPSNNTPYIGQVGWNTWEDIYVGRPGRNFGWPCYEGNFVQSGYQAYSACQSLYAAGNRTAPLISYAHYSGGTAVTGGPFYTGSNFPAQYQGMYFYSDYGHSFIHAVQLDANDNLISDNVFMPDVPNVGIVNLEQGPDGYLYYPAISANAVQRIRYNSATSPPIVTASASPTNGLLPLAVTFSSAGTNDPNGRPLTYDWDFGDGTAHSATANPSHTYTVRGTYTVTLRVSNNVPSTTNWSTTIAAGSNPPTVSLGSPQATLLYKVGDVINYSGSGTDFDGTPLTGAALAWDIIIHHCPGGSCHTHYLWQGTGASGSITVPDHGDDVYLEFILTATNSAGLKTSSAVSVHPQTVNLTLDTVPTGLQVVYDGDQATTPRTQVSVVGSQHTLFPPSPQVSGRATFGSWSDGGAQQHNVTAPASNANYTATFNVASGPPNRSLALDGTDWASSLVAPALNITSDWTVETWFKDENPAGYTHDYAYIVTKSDTNAQGEAPYMLSISWNNLNIEILANWVKYGLSYNLVSNGVSANHWHHVAATLRASTNTLTLYLDGVQVAQQNVAAHSVSGNSLPVGIGRNGNTGAFFTGKVDDVRIWNVARTGAQIQANYTTPYVGAPTGLVSNWELTEGSGTSSADNTPTGANLTLNGATWSSDTPQTPAGPTATPTPTNTPLPGTATPTATPAPCPCTIFPTSAAPTNLTSTDGNALEIGVKFRVDTPGFISGIRFYKLNGNTGTHIGNLWASNGTLMGTAAFVGETATGWQQVNFATPIAVAANTTYVASYFAPAGHYAINSNYFATSTDRAPLHAPDSGSSGGNGVYAYNGSSTFPNQSFNAANYWVDAIFSTTPPVATNTPTPTNTPLPGQPTNTPTATPTSTTVPTSTPTPTNTATPGPSSCPCTIFTTQLPSNTAGGNDTNAVELGIKFTSDQNGFITGIRYYKPAANTGTHIGSLWSTSGTLLARATFSGETTSGWQQVSFSPAVAVTAGTTYVASYHSDGGHYVGDLNYLNAALDNAPLHGLATGPSGGNGVYIYSGTPAFPNNSYQASNYWVDVVFNTVVPPTPTPTNTSTPGPSATPTRTPTPTVTPTPPACPCSVFAANAVPSNPGGGTDTNAVELGMKFRSDQNGFISAVRFYKTAANTGTHVVNLWTTSGTLLATATATGESASGWQTVNLSSQVAITAGTTYIVSYHTNTGHYGADLNYFTADVNNSVLHAPSSGSSGGNGVYMYGAGSAFPSNTFSSANYWVDVVFHP